jgi:hypothetical protein
MLWVLIHSPLVGISTWAKLVPELRGRGIDVLVPALTDDGAPPYWQQHAESVAQALKDVPDDQPLILVGHSGAGPILPAIRQALRQPVAAYVFLDAGVPKHHATRLQMLREELPDAAAQLLPHLEQGGTYPNWTDEILQPLIPDDEVRWAVLDKLHPRPLDFFTEAIPVFEGFPDAPCFYLQLSAGYDYSVQEAVKRGWRVAKIDAGHFHMLVDAKGVADRMIQWQKVLRMSDDYKDD